MALSLPPKQKEGVISPFQIGLMPSSGSMGVIKIFPNQGMKYGYAKVIIQNGWIGQKASHTRPVFKSLVLSWSELQLGDISLSVASSVSMILIASTPQYCLEPRRILRCGARR